MEADERRHEARVTQHLEAGNKREPQKSGIFGPGPNRARVSVGRHGVESTSRDVADNKREQHDPLPVAHVKGACLATFLFRAQRNVVLQVVEVMWGRTDHHLPLG